MKTQIKCPNCGFQIEIEEVIAHSLKRELEDEYQRKLTQALENQKQLVALEKDKFYAEKLEELRQILKTKEQMIEKLDEKEAKLAEKEQAILKKQREMEEEIANEVHKRQALLEEEIRKSIGTTFTYQIEALNKQLNEKEEALKKLVQELIEVREKQKSIEEEAQRIKLEALRQVDEERERIRQRIFEQTQAEFDLKLAEKDKMLEDMRRQITELKRKSEIGSQQAQGEVQEIALEEVLKMNFPLDIIEAVPKGFTGADVIQNVYSKNGMQAGKIIWESKRTKEWKREWIEKLKNDQLASQSDIAIIVTQALPKEIENFGMVENIWVTNFQSAISLAKALRWALIGIQMTKNSLAGKDEKMELLYQYLTSSTFHNKMKLIIDTFTKMQEDLERERRAMEKLWGEREKQIERILKNVSFMYGELTDLTNNALPKIDGLELLPEGSADGQS